MPQDGIKTLARWREAGEWWCGEPAREVHRFLDVKGIRREEVKALASGPTEAISDIRIRRTKDEKVSLATGHFTPPRYGKKPAGPRTSVVLHALSGYAFCKGTMIAAEIPAFAAERGYGAALLADPFSLTGAREFCHTAEEVGIHPLVGSTFEMPEGGELVLVARDSDGYRSLSRLITECHLQEPRLYPLCDWERLERHTEGLLCLTGGGTGLIDRMLVRKDYQGALATVQRLVGFYGRENVFLQVERSFLPWEVSLEPVLNKLAEKTNIVQVAGGPIHHERSDHFPAHDVLVCIDSLCTIDEIEGRKPPRDPSQPEIAAVPRRGLNGERYLRSSKQMKALYADRTELLSNAWQIVERCERNVLPGMTVLPKYCENEDEVLRAVTMVGASTRYPTLAKPLKRRLDHELERIIRLGFSRHFLTAWDMCNWARGQSILLSGRGSVVDSMVSYCLGISRIDAYAFKLHFDRFLPNDGSKRPDIDIDFEAARREDVRQYLVTKYGENHVATVAAIGTFGSRGIIRAVGKVMGIPESSVSYLTKRLHGGVTPERLESAIEARPELRDSDIPRERFRWVFKLAERMMDLPRNMRAHSSGVVISETPIADTVPVMQSGADGVRIIQWDKRSAKRSFDKFDVLCLRGNDVLGGTQRNVGNGFDVTSLPLDDDNVFRAMRAGELVGIPQSASPAMRQAHIRIKTKNLKDAGIVQAGIRPGVGGAVKLNEYVARRNNKQYRLIHKDLESILGPTLGIVVFQEQIDQLLQTFGGYTGDDAEAIREGIHKNRRDYAAEIRGEVVARIISKGYSQAVAQEVYELVSGFKGYGFAEGHALSFAEVSIRSIYCQQNHPAPYFAALLDAQPAGYYGPATIANEARSRGVKVLPPDVDLSEETFRVEDVLPDEEPLVRFPGTGVRVSLRQISGLSAETRMRILLGRPYSSFFDFVARAGPAQDELEQLVLCGACDAFCSNRRALLWVVPVALSYSQTLKESRGALPLFNTEPVIPGDVNDFSDADKAISERRILGMDVDQHLMGFERQRVRSKGGLSAREASCLRPGTEVFVVGNPIRLRFPPTQSGRRVMFFDLEDETGLLNVTCFDDVYQRDGHKVICNPYITLWGETQDRDGHLSFLARRVVPYKPFVALGVSEECPLPLVISDFLMS